VAEIGVVTGGDDCRFSQQKLFLAPEVICEHCEEDYFKGIEEMVRNYESSRLVNDTFESFKQLVA